MSEEIIQNLDALNVTMNGGSTLLNIVLAFVMFGVALGIKPATFVDIIKNPKSIITGITCQLVLLPALTLCLIMICGHWISPMIALGMILVASCPGGNISNFITSLSRGNSELSVSLTAFNTAACVITTPLNFAFWGKMYLNFQNLRYHSGKYSRASSSSWVYLSCSVSSAASTFQRLQTFLRSLCSISRSLYSLLWSS